jgi:hypothetical protein
MLAIGLFAQHVRALEVVAGPGVPPQLEALAVAASAVTAGAAEDCLQVIPRCPIRGDDPHLRRCVRHADILPKTEDDNDPDCQPSRLTFAQPPAPVFGNVPRAWGEVRPAPSSHLMLDL